MDNNGGSSAPTSSKRSGPFVDIINVIDAKLTNKRAAIIQNEINVPKDHENCQQINKDSTSKIQRASTIGFGNENNASVITPVRLPSTNNAELSYGTPNTHEDVTNLSTAELKRKRAREWYASLTKEQKGDRNKKRREIKQCISSQHKHIPVFLSSLYLTLRTSLDPVYGMYIPFRNDLLIC